MRTRTKIGVTLSAILVLGIAYVCWMYYKYQTYSFSPERPEQSQLAKEHAECGAFYYLRIHRSIKSGKQLSQDEKLLQTSLEAHGKIGLNFSPDKKQFQVDTETSMERMSKEIISAGEAKTLEKYIEDKEVYCFELMLRTSKFQKEVLKSRAATE